METNLRDSVHTLQQIVLLLCLLWFKKTFVFMHVGVAGDSERMVMHFLSVSHQQF